MTLVLDPVWPWSRLWEVLLQLPAAIRSLAGVAMLLALPLAALSLGRNRRPLHIALAAALAMTLVLLARHLGPLALADGRYYAGSGLLAYPAAAAILLGWVVLLVGPTALAGLSVATYLSTPRLSRWRTGFVCSLRLLAFLIALVALLRPAFAWAERGDTRSVLFVILDRSGSMTIQDESGNRTRFELALRCLRDAAAAIDRLRDDHGVDVRLYSFGDDLAEFDPEQPGEADGKRTDVGGMLRRLFDLREPRVTLRGVAIVSDGADNGPLPALAEAARWRVLPCPIHTFACGSPRTSLKHKDVAITSISTSPTPFVPIKGRLNVKVTIDARGYENSTARVRLFLEGEDDKGNVADREVLAKNVVLPLTTGNEVTLTADAPAKAGEVKVKVVVEPPEADHFPTNNVIETFVTVSKEGISVLLVDRARAFEPMFIHDALAQDPRIRVTMVLLRGGKPAGVTGKLFSIDEQPYDVVILGDVTAAQLRALDPEALEKIEKLAARGSGILALGGLTNLGNGDWKGTPLEAILPVDLSVKGQIDRPVRVAPTEDGLRRVPYILRLDDNPDLKKAWERLAKLDGATRLQLPDPPRGTELVLARVDTDKGDPLLVMGSYARKDDKGKAGNVARVLAFGGDTTYRWKRSEEGERLHTRFWRQVVVWLAKQEDAEGSVWVKPDVRRLPVRGELGFQVGLRGKGGGPDIAGGKYEAEVVGPDGATVKVPVVRGSTENRGTFAATAKPGIYRVVVRGEGKDPAGGVVSGQASARVIVYDEDVEMQRPAADPEFLRKLSSAGGGEALRVEQLADFLNRLAEQPLDRGKPKLLLRPDWRTTQRSGFLVGFFLAFSVVVCLEWTLRRRWGMV